MKVVITINLSRLRLSKDIMKRHFMAKFGNQSNSISFYFLCESELEAYELGKKMGRSKFKKKDTLLSFQ